MWAESVIVPAHVHGSITLHVGQGLGGFRSWGSAQVQLSVLGAGRGLWCTRGLVQPHAQASQALVLQTLAMQSEEAHQATVTACGGAGAA